MNLSVRFSSAIVILTAAFSVIPAAKAARLGAVDIHGFGSISAAYSPDYNFLGNTKGGAALVLNEAALNASYTSKLGIRFTGQIYGYKQEDYTDVSIDLLNADYSWKEWLGIRLGRNRTFGGLYNESRDIDSIRVFAFLPLGVYNPDFRALRAKHDGVDLYGSVAAGGAGSFEYQAFYGKMPDLDGDGNFLRWIDSTNPLHQVGGTTDRNWGYALVWNTPLEGLRFSLTSSTIENISYRNAVGRTAEEVSWSPSDLRALPGFFPPGVWDAVVAGVPAPTNLDHKAQTYSVEYAHGSWVFAAEYQRFRALGVSRMPIGDYHFDVKTDSWYVSASWQATKRLGLGAYYEEYYPDVLDRSGTGRVFSPAHTAYTKGWTFASACKVTEWWLLKAEVHLLDGTTVLRNDRAQNGVDPNRWGKSWSYFVLKNTFSF